MRIAVSINHLEVIAEDAAEAVYLAKLFNLPTEDSSDYPDPGSATVQPQYGEYSNDFELKSVRVLP